MNDERDCSVCGGAHCDDTEALVCVGAAWRSQSIQISSLEKTVAEATSYTVSLLKKLDDANDVVWDEAIPYGIDPSDVEHAIHSHADTLPERYKRLAEALVKIQQITNWRPEPG